jgi:hypothetical protein
MTMRNPQDDDVYEEGAWTDDCDPADLKAWLDRQTAGLDFDYRDSTDGKDG